MQKINILMVDDNPDNLTALEAVLAAPDRNLVRAASGEEALRYLLSHEAAVILLDVRMPRIDGFETASLIRGRERTRNVPIIFLTAYQDAGSAHLTRGYSLGAVDYIIKPFDPEILRSKVAVFVELFRKTELLKQQAELLREQNIALENSSLQRLSRLIDLGQQLAAERDPEQLLQIYCHATRDIIGARYATIGILDLEEPGLRHFITSGFDRETAISDELQQRCLELLEQLKDQLSHRATRLTGGLPHDCFPAAGARVSSFLGAPIRHQGEVQGWLYLADKIGADEFNEADERMAVTLTQAFVFYENARLYEEAQRHAQALESEVIERQKAAEERNRLLKLEQAARAEAERANRLKDEFLATVSHELRTPLNAMLGWVSVVRGGRLDEAGVARALETVERNARAQKRLIDDLLDVSRIITGKLRLDIRMIELTSLIESVVDSVRPAAEARGVQLQTWLSLSPVMLPGDLNRLQQVVWNLISNAIKFTPAGGRVEVRLSQMADEVGIAVSDTGAGITPEFLPYVFDRFRQADGSSTRKHGGLGLGLAIVRHLVELHGGTVRAESEGAGRGATFTITLPLTRAALSDKNDAVLSPGGTATLSDSAPRLTGLRVLIVDDEADSRKLLSTILSQSEARVETAESAAEAIRLMEAWQPEVLISDISMPVMDGFELIQQLRQHNREQISHIPAIALTAYARAEDRIRALAAGYQMHLAKPVEPDELVVTIASLTGRLARVQSTGEKD
ncbi:MAG TPA: response regulator [Blastocatellia bacterium]|nr:response regulator [Blastocatellia bacterium]